MATLKSGSFWRLSRSGHRIARGHLRLADTSPRAGRARSRTLLLARGLLIRARILLLNLLALLGALAALAPLMLRRRPLQQRAQAPRRTTRVIPLPERRATPR